MTNSSVTFNLTILSFILNNLISGDEVLRGNGLDPSFVHLRILFPELYKLFLGTFFIKLCMNTTGNQLIRQDIGIGKKLFDQTDQNIEE